MVATLQELLLKALKHIGENICHPFLQYMCQFKHLYSNFLLSSYSLMVLRSPSNPRP